MKKFYLCAMLLLMAATTQAQNQMSAKAEKYMLTIKYLYAADSSDAHPEYTAKLEENELYSVVSPEVAGYKPDRDTVKGTMPAHDITETVYYSIKSYTVTVSANPADGGTVTGGGPYNHGDTCTVIATANEGYAFVNWTKNDSIVSTEAEYRFLVTEDCTFVANFTATLPPTYTITVSANPSNGGTVTGGGTYNQGQSCTVTATPASGYTFLRWTENGSQVSTNASYTFNVTENRALVASFTATPPPTYTITVSANPSNGGTVTGGGTYNQGQSCTVTATANTGYTFTNWTENGNVVSSEQSYTFTVAANRNLVAHFEPAGTPPVIVGNIEAPAAICAGGVLNLTAPSVTNAVTKAWQLSPDSSFETIEVYEGQPLDASYNGWKLRYMASNDFGTVYSNVVGIVIHDLSSIVLTGDQNICSGQECIYKVGNNVGVGLTCTWSVSDPHAIVEPLGSRAKVIWGSKGTHQVEVLVKELESGCSESLVLQVNVQSYIDGNDVQDIVAKKHEGKAYLLIYPNPNDTYKYQWYKDGTAIAGANGQYYYPTGGLADGDYQVYISFNADAQGNLFCGAFSTVYTVSERSAVFSIYPNPGKTGEQLMAVNKGKDAKVSVHTLDGKLVYQQEVAHGTHPIDVVLPQGLYVVHFNDGEHLKSERIVIR